MTQKDWENHVDTFLETMRNVLKAKGKDYSDGNKDRLQNFKDIGQAAGVGSHQAALVLAAKHWDAISRHCRGIKCVTENVQQRLVDLANYAVLISAIEKDVTDAEAKVA